MGLTDRILEYYHKADDFILEKHIEIANWANYNFGKSNYELSTYSAFLPLPLIFASYAYNAAASNIDNLPSDLFFLGAATVLAYRTFKSNQEMERREQISLESMAKDSYVENYKKDAQFWGPFWFLASSIAISYYTLFVITGAPFDTKLVQLSYFTMALAWGTAEYFRRVDYKPRKKGRVPEAVKDAIHSLLRRPIATHSEA